MLLSIINKFCILLRYDLIFWNTTPNITSAHQSFEGSFYSQRCDRVRQELTLLIMHNFSSENISQPQRKAFYRQQ